jgi:uncharacterized protein YnzC (UPF0291/DUF896 family)
LSEIENTKKGGAGMTKKELELKRKLKREYMREWRKKNPRKQRAM